MSTGAPSLSEPVQQEAVRLGRTPGMKPVHAVVAGLFALFWVGVLVVVLTLGKDDGSAVDVYAELPPGFTAGLQSQGVTYAGLSPVDDSIRDQVLSHAPSDVALPSGVEPIVLRTVVSDSAQGESLQGRAALMVVVAEPESGPVHVAFLDPATYQLLTSVTYSGASPSR